MTGLGPVTLLPTPMLPATVMARLVRATSRGTVPE
jgi:hypothetical protein